MLIRNPPLYRGGLITAMPPYLTCASLRDQLKAPKNQDAVISGALITAGLPSSSTLAPQGVDAADAVPGSQPVPGSLYTTRDLPAGPSQTGFSNSKAM